MFDNHTKRGQKTKQAVGVFAFGAVVGFFLFIVGLFPLALAAIIGGTVGAGVLAYQRSNILQETVYTCRLMGPNEEELLPVGVLGDVIITVGPDNANCNVVLDFGNPNPTPKTFIDQVLEVLGLTDESKSGRHMMDIPLNIGPVTKPMQPKEEIFTAAIEAIRKNIVSDNNPFAVDGCHLVVVDDGGKKEKFDM
jgi:hypothetical protein